MHRTIILIYLLVIVIRFLEGLFAYRPDNRERSIEYRRCFLGMADVLIGIADSDRTHSMGETTTHTSNGKGYE